MKIIAFLLLFGFWLSAAAQKTHTLKFDGIYQTKADAKMHKSSNLIFYNYMRFYPNGKAITAASTGTIPDLKVWFNLDMKNISIGDYTIKGKRIFFITASKAGTTLYSGKIKKNGMLLKIKVKSLTEGGKTWRQLYYFIQVADLN